MKWVSEHRDYGNWTNSHDAREGRVFIVDFLSDSRDFSSAERLAQKIIDAWMADNLDPHMKTVTLVVTTTRLRKKASPTKRDVYVPTGAIAYNPETDAYENAMGAFLEVRNGSPYPWGTAR